MSDEPAGNHKKKRGRVENLKPWPKGVSGNPKGRPPGPSLTNALRKLLEKMGQDATLEAIARAWIGKAVKGDSAFFTHLLERLDGKVTQKTELTGGDGGPIETRTTVTTEELWERYKGSIASGIESSPGHVPPSNGNGNGNGAAK